VGWIVGRSSCVVRLKLKQVIDVVEKRGFGAPVPQCPFHCYGW